MRRRVRLTEGQLRDIVEETSRRVIQEMMNEGGVDKTLNALRWTSENLPKWCDWVYDKVFGSNTNTNTQLGSNLTQNGMNGASQLGAVGAAHGVGAIGAANGATQQYTPQLGSNLNLTQNGMNGTTQLGWRSWYC